MFEAVTRTLAQMFSAPFRSVLWRALGWTLLLIAGIGAAGFWGIDYIPEVEAGGWLSADMAGILNTVIDILTGAAVIAAVIFLIVPVAAIFIPLFQDEIAAAVESRYYPDEMGPREQGVMEGVRLGLKALFLMLVVNLFALPLILLLPGLGFVIFLVVNGFLLGREFFEAAAIRHYEPDEVKTLRGRNVGRVFLAGLVIAALLAVPIANILVPIFGTALMVHVLHRIQARSAGF